MRTLLTRDREEWHTLLKWLPEEVQDIHFWPEMMFPYEVTNRGKGGLLVDESSGGLMLHAVLKVDANTFHHPFNFGGPVATPEYNRRTAYGRVYCTLNPFLTAAHQPLLPAMEYSKEAVWVDLTKPLKFRQTTRHAVEKASKACAEFAVVPKDSANIDTFAEMYEHTMDRAAAKNHWYFDKAWFLSFLINLNSHATLCMVKINGKIESGCILLHGYGTCYYHFAASYRNHPNSGANHFMVAKACEVARDMKCKRLHLGGGVERRDGLFTFKSGFSDLTLPVYKYSPELVNEVSQCSPSGSRSLQRPG